MTRLKMKTPKLKFQTVYIVDSWQTEIIEGIGTYFETFNEYLSSCNNVWIVFVDTIPRKIYADKVYIDYSKAIQAVEKEKKDYLKYLKKTVNESLEKIKTLEQ